MKKRITLLMSIIVVLLAMTGCNNTVKPNDVGTNTVREEKFEEKSNPSKDKNISIKPATSGISEKISVISAVAENGEVVAIAKNENDMAVDIVMEIEFYKADGSFVDSDKSYAKGVEAESEIAVAFYNISADWDNCKIYVNAEQTEYKTYHGSLSVDNSNTNDEVVIQVTNNSDEVIGTISVAVVYYKGEKIVGLVSDSEFQIKPGEAANYTFRHPYGKSYEYVDFDTYKVFINEARSYGY